MGRQKVQKNAKQAPIQVKETQIQKDDAQLADRDVERQSSAIRAIRDVEIERLLTELRLLRSYFNDEQLMTPVLQFFVENFPNLSMFRNGENGQAEMQWNNKEGEVYMDDRRDVHAALLHQLSIASSEYSAPITSLGGFEFSSKAVKTRLLAADDLQIGDLVLDEPSEIQMLGMQDALRTPGMSSQRLSIGTTPKTLRLPKPGEVLLSVHGSPLGVYKEDNMEAIHESEEG